MKISFNITSFVGLLITNLLIDVLTADLQVSTFVRFLLSVSLAVFWNSRLPIMNIEKIEDTKDKEKPDEPSDPQIPTA
jgi:hypothetical protein